MQVAAVSMARKTCHPRSLRPTPNRRPRCWAPPLGLDAVNCGRRGPSASKRATVHGWLWRAATVGCHGPWAAALSLRGRVVSRSSGWWLAARRAGLGLAGGALGVLPRR